MRTFKLVNKDNESCDLTTKSLFFHSPKGLGFSHDYEFRRLGNRFVVVNRQPKQESITGNIAVLGKDPYNGYFQLVQFLSKVPLVLKYVPNNEGGTTPSGTEYSRDVVVSKLDKTELTRQGYLDCGITLAALGPWYVEKTVSNSSEIDTGEDSDESYNLIWSNNDESPTSDSANAMHWIDERVEIISTSPTIAELKTDNRDLENVRHWEGNTLVFNDGSIVEVTVDSENVVRYVSARNVYSSSSAEITIPLHADIGPGTVYTYKADIYSVLELLYFGEGGTIDVEVIQPNLGSKTAEFSGQTPDEIHACVRLTALNDKVITVPTISKKNRTSGEIGFIKFPKSDSVSTGVYAPSSENNSTRLTIYGLSSGDTIEWTQYVDGVEYAVGRINGVVLSPDECLVVDCISVPGSIYKKNLITGTTVDVYDHSDFSTKRFLELQNGTNTVVVKSVSLVYGSFDLNYKWEARITYESV